LQQNISFIFLKSIITILVLQISIWGCESKVHKSHNAVVQKKVYFNPILPEKIKLNISIDSGYKKRSLAFRETVNMIFGKYYLNYINKSKELIYRPLFTNEQSHAIPINKFLENNSSSFSVVVKDSIIYSFIKGQSIVYALHIGQDFTIKQIDSFNFDKDYDKDEIYIKGSIDQPFQIIDNSFFFPIGSLSKRKKFVNGKAYLAIINTNNEEVKATQILPSPQEYIDGLRQSMVTFIVGTKNNEAALLFQDIDRIVSFNTADMNITGTNDFNPYSNFEPYDYDQGRDLGYVRVYAETNEANLKIISLNNGIVIIKKVRSKNIYEKGGFEYLVLNNKNKLVNYDSIPYQIQPFLSFAYENGFVLMNSNMSDGYYYEIL